MAPGKVDIVTALRNNVSNLQDHALPMAAEACARGADEITRLRNLIIACEETLGANLVWIADNADLAIRQEDPDTLRRLAWLQRTWELLAKESAGPGGPGRIISA